MKKTIFLFLLCAVLLVSGCSQGEGGSEEPGAQAEEPETQADQPEPEAEMIKIGFMGPLSGDAASYGETILEAVELSLENSDVSGRVEIVKEDSKCDPKEAVSAVNKLISVDGVQAIIGEVCSGATLAAAPVARDNSVAMISAASTSPEITKFPNVFRTVPSDEFQGAFGAEIAAGKGYTKMAVLHGNEDYGIGFKNVLEKSFPGEGRSVVITETFERGDVDLKTQLTKIKESGADVLYIISNSPDSSSAALKQAAELKLNLPLMGSEGLKDDDLLASVGSAAEGLLVTSVSSGAPEFIASWTEEKGSEPGPFAAQGYDAFTAVSIAINSGAGTKEAIMKALGDVKFSGASGEIAFDSNGDVGGGYEIYVVKGGSFVREQ